MTATTSKLRTLGDLKRALKDATAVFVRVPWSPDRQPEFVQTSAKQLLQGIGGDASPDDGGWGDSTAVRAQVSEGAVYVG